MNIICNSCVGGFIYKNELKTPFGTPFIWNIIDSSSMLYLIKNYENIDFGNYDLIKDKNWNFSIIIDEHVTVKYVHYKFDANANTPYVKYIDYYSNKVWEYIVQKYEERKNRMLADHSIPYFIFANWFNVKETNLTYDLLKTINGLNKSNLICAVDKIYPEFTNIKQVTRDSDKMIYNPGLAKKIYNAFIRGK